MFSETLTPLASKRRHCKDLIAGHRPFCKPCKTTPIGPSIQKHGCNAQAKLIRRKDDYQKLLAESGGANNVLHGMERHKSVDDVQQYGCKVLAVMTCNVDN